MTILKTINTGNGLALAHRAVKAEIAGERLRVQVHSYPNADTATDDHLLWQEYPELPLAALDAADPWVSIERALVAQADGPMAGGTCVPDAAADELATARAKKWAQVKGERARLEASGFDAPGLGCFASDAESRSRITGAALAAKIAKDGGQPYAVEWTLADGGTARLDADAAMRVCAVMIDHLHAIHLHSRRVYALIAAAQNADAVAAIGWNSAPEAHQETPRKKRAAQA